MRNVSAICLTLIFLLTGIFSLRADLSFTTTCTKGWSKMETRNNIGLTTSIATGRD